MEPDPARNWRAAAAELGVQIVAPFEADLGDGHVVRAQMLVCEFGARRGTLVVKDSETFWACQELAAAAGFAISCFEVGSERTPVSRYSLVNLVSDWCWEGDSNATPQWLYDYRRVSNEDVASWWAHAASDFEIDVHIPAVAALPDGGEFRADVHILNFGLPSGTLIVTDREEAAIPVHALETIGLRAIIMPWYADVECFDPEVGALILRELGWSGPAGQRPVWL